MSVSAGPSKRFGRPRSLKPTDQLVWLGALVTVLVALGVYALVSGRVITGGAYLFAAALNVDLMRRVHRSGKKSQGDH